MLHHIYIFTTAIINFYHAQTLFLAPFIPLTVQSSCLWTFPWFYIFHIRSSYLLHQKRFFPSLHKPKSLQYSLLCSISQLSCNHRTLSHFLIPHLMHLYDSGILLWCLISFAFNLLQQLMEVHRYNCETHTVAVLYVGSRRQWCHLYDRPGVWGGHCWVTVIHADTYDVQKTCSQEFQGKYYRLLQRYKTKIGQHPALVCARELQQTTCFIVRSSA